MQRVEYRKAKKFKLDDDLEVADFFTGSAKNPIKADWNDYGGDKRNCQLYASPIRRLTQSCVGKKWDEVNSYFKRKIKNRTRYQQYTLNDMFESWNKIDKAILVDGELKYVNQKWWSNNNVRPGDLYIDSDGFVRRMPLIKKKRYYRWERENTKFSDPYGVKSVKTSKVDSNVVYKQVENEYRIRLGDGKTKPVLEYNWFKWTHVEYMGVEHYYDREDKQYKSRPALKTRLDRKSASKKDIRDFKLNEVK